MLQSIRRHEPKAELFLLALDDDVYKAAQGHGIHVIPKHKVETPEIAAQKDNRNYVEYIWLFQPAFPAFLLDVGLERVMMLDGDIWFFNSPRPLFGEIKTADVAVHPHRFPPQLQHLAKRTGVYNGGATYFRNTQIGRDCVNEWLENCIEWDLVWTDPRPGPGRGQICGTQGYLDYWPQDYGAHIVEHLGCNLAPWNQMQYTYESWKVEGLYPIVFYHFHGLGEDRYPIHPWVQENIYRSYLREIQRVE